MLTILKPYLLRAVYEWCTDNSTTPYISVVVDKHCQVPGSFVKDGKITLNISSEACDKLVINSQEVNFFARFAGKVSQVVVPIHAITAIFASESGQGITFEPGLPPEFDPDGISESTKQKKALGEQKSEAQSKNPRHQLRRIK